MEAKENIRWNTLTEWVDLETGEKITLEQAKKEYVIVKTKTHSHVYRTTGTKTITRQCRRSKQIKIEF